MSILSSTRSLLQAWGYWGGVRVGTELPSCSPMFRAIIKQSPTLATIDDIEECERAVCKVEPIERRILILRYQRMYFPWKLSREYGISQRTAYRMLERAEWAVHVELGR